MLNIPTVNAYNKNIARLLEMPAQGYNAVTIPIEMHEILKAVSEKTGKSMSAIVSEAILNYVEPKAKEPQK